MPPPPGRSYNEVQALGWASSALACLPGAPPPSTASSSANARSRSSWSSAAGLGRGSGSGSAAPASELGAPSPRRRRHLAWTLARTLALTLVPNPRRRLTRRGSCADGARPPAPPPARRAPAGPQRPACSARALRLCSRPRCTCSRAPGRALPRLVRRRVRRDVRTDALEGCSIRLPGSLVRPVGRAVQAAGHRALRGVRRRRWMAPACGRLARGDVGRGAAAAGAPQVEADERDGAPRLRGAGVTGVVGRRRRPVQQRAEVAARLRHQQR